MSATESGAGGFIGKYRCSYKLAVGGTATVWRVFNERQDDFVLKHLFLKYAKDRNIRSSFDNEYRFGRTFVHPNLIRVLDRGVHDGSPFIVMEYFRAGTLRKLLVEAKRSVVVALAAKITVGVAEALQYVHERGIVHRDVKPENILVTENGDVRLIDFASAIAGAAKWLPFARRAVGSPSYVAPEQLRRRRATPACDVYSLGCVVFEMFAGRPPFVGRSLDEVVSMQLRSTAPPLTQFNQGITPEFNRFVAAMLAKRPEERIPNMAMVIQRFNAIGPLG